MDNRVNQSANQDDLNQEEMALQKFIFARGTSNRGYLSNDREREERVREYYSRTISVFNTNHDAKVELNGIIKTHILDIKSTDIDSKEGVFDIYKISNLNATQNICPGGQWNLIPSNKEDIKLTINRLALLLQNKKLNFTCGFDRCHIIATRYFKLGRDNKFNFIRLKQNKKYQ